MIFGLIGQVITSYFSRTREFRADKGGAQYAGKEKMLAALEALNRDYSVIEVQKEEGKLAAFQISSKSKFLQLLSTHPPLNVRIRALRGF